MELNLSGIADVEAYAAAGIQLPSFDVAMMQEEGKAKPRWVHLGPGNIFRVFPARVAHDLLSDGEHWPITAVVAMDPTELDRQLAKHDLMTLSVILNPDGTRDTKVIASLSEGLAWQREADFARLCEIIADPQVTMVTMTITEKGYAIHDSQGALLPDVLADIATDPLSFHKNTMANLAGLLVRRFNAGAAPINMISFDNFSHNGDKLSASILEVLQGWLAAGLIEQEVLDWVQGEQVAFPITVIDKITPRPNEELSEELAALGFTDMQLELLGRTPLAGFVNAEPTEYLIIEDVLVGEVPDLTKYGVILTSREVCDDFEHMKVTTCLNPLHTALAVAGVLLDFSTIDSEMRDPALRAFVERLGWQEGLPVVVDPGIVTPEDFLREVLEVRFPNPFLPDDPRRIAMDTSQKLPIRFGETIKKYLEQEKDLAELKALPLVIALWLRYLLAVDDFGKDFVPSSDPLLEELQAHLAGIKLGFSAEEGHDVDKEIHDAVAPILSNPSIFAVNLHETPLAEYIEKLFKKLIAGTGAVRTTLEEVVL